MENKGQIKSKKMQVQQGTLAKRPFFRPLQSIDSSKAQIKIQEMAFVMLALALLAMIGFIFFMRFQSENIAKAGEEAKQSTAISLLDKIASMQELRCEKGEICIDEDKIEIIKDKSMGNLFQGLKKVEIKRIYPEGEGPGIVIWQSTTIPIGRIHKPGPGFMPFCPFFTPRHPAASLTLLHCSLLPMY